MKTAGFYLDAWLVAKNLNRPLTSIHKISVAQGYLIAESEWEEDHIPEILHERKDINSIMEPSHD